MKFKRFLKKLITLALVFGLLYGGYWVLANQTPVLRTYYYVEFDTDCKDVKDTKVEVDKDGTIKLPTLTREGYTFGGWYSNGIRWDETKKVKSDTVLVARWIPDKFDITFIVDGVSKVVSSNYDSIPVFPGTPTKESTVSVEYTFAGWEPSLEKVTKEATYTAKFTSSTRKYALNINVDGGGTVTGKGSYEYGSNPTITATAKKGYSFVGWYKDGSLYSSSASVTINNFTQNTEFTAKFDLIKYTINYVYPSGLTNNNPASYTVEDSSITLSSLSKDYYSFNGWYTASNGGGTRVTKVTTSDAKNITLYAYFTPIKYTITYTLNGGSLSGSYATSYTYESSAITLPTPTKTGSIFLGWKGTGLSDTTETVIIPANSNGNRSYVAIWDDPEGVTTTLSFKSGLNNLTNYNITGTSGTAVTLPTLSASVNNMDGYTFNGWYYDEACTNKASITTMPSVNTTLYASWTYTLDKGFYPWKSEFDANYNSSDTFEINSETEFIAFMDYVFFYNITTQQDFELTYKSLSGTSLQTYIKQVYKKSTCAVGSGITYNYLGTIPSLACSSKEPTTFSVVDPTGSGTYKQQKYGMERIYTQKRSNSNTYFHINNVNETIEVSTSNQLTYALSMGLRPICESGSAAEEVYNDAVKVLNKICDDSMSDIKKLEAIYEWLVLNVEYDHIAASDSNSYADNWPKYDSWYAEGVFDNGIAVCDGISKAMLILSKIENIPAVRCTGDAHAWNRVYVNGKWYGIDATHGESGDPKNSISVLSYSQFLFTDSWKTGKGYTSDNYTSIVANTVYNYFDEVSYTYNGTTFDYVMDTQAEFNALMCYIKARADFSSMTEFTIELVFAGLPFNTSTWAQLTTALDAANIVGSLSYYPTTNSNGDTMYLFLIGLN